jgi:hypothetical protein
MSDHIRILNADLDMSKYIELEDGLLVKDVPILAVGTWTDSAVKTALYYGAPVIREYCKNWKADGFWAKHSGGAPRSVMDLLGDVREMRFDETFQTKGMSEPGAMLGDLFYSYATQNGRDAAAQAKARAKLGKPLAVSVEHGGDEAFNPQTNRLEAQSLVFYGLASVEKGACKVCTLPKRTDEESPTQKEVISMDEPKVDFAKMLSESEARILKAVDDKFSALKVPDTSEGMKAMSATVESSMKELEAAKQRIKALEEEPRPKTVPESESKSKELDVAPVKGPRIMGNSVVCE